jgi:antitoxin (DNA-binding transcriptional repressor) of toxin-antitoxin stability system
MKASFLDLRKRSRQIIEALRRNERITVLYRGKPAAVMHPIGEGDRAPAAKARDHAAFGMWRDRSDLIDVEQHVRNLRRSRFGDL